MNEKKIRYTNFSGEHGHNVDDIDEKELLKRVNKGMKEGQFVLVKTDDGEIISTAAVIHEKDSEKAKEETKKVKKKLKEKTGKIKEATEMKPVSGG